MPEPTYPTQADEAIRRVTGNKVLAEPATPAACARDFAAGTADRVASEKRDAKARR
jgi:hypothetical protein